MSMEQLIMGMSPQGISPARKARFDDTIATFRATPGVTRIDIVEQKLGHWEAYVYIQTGPQAGAIIEDIRRKEAMLKARYVYFIGALIFAR